MKVNAPAKVNLALDILSRRPDGYHEMDMVNARIPQLYDTLDIEPAQSDSVEFIGLDVPADNTVFRALQLLREHGLRGHYRILVTKRIPEQAGLGGGSADAAALLQALNGHEQLGLTLAQLEEIGAQIGADVPCCLHDGFTRVRSIGDQVRDLPVSWKIPVLLVQGPEGISTPEAFAVFDAGAPFALDVGIVQSAVLRQDLSLLYQTMTNAFEKPAFRKIPSLAALRENMLDAGMVRVMMTGSGSCMMGFCVDDDVMEEAARILSGQYPFVWKGWIGA